jgi:hypothetical protein
MFYSNLESKLTKKYWLPLVNFFDIGKVFCIAADEILCSNVQTALVESANGKGCDCIVIGQDMNGSETDEE